MGYEAAGSIIYAGKDLGGAYANSAVNAYTNSADTVLPFPGTLVLCRDSVP